MVKWCRPSTGAASVDQAGGSMRAQGQTLNARRLLGKEIVPDWKRQTLCAKRCVRNQIVDGLAYCHACGIVHRDVKLDNLLLDSHRNIRIVDFGLLP